MTDGEVPVEMIPDEHLIVDNGEDDDADTSDIEIVPAGGGRGAAVYGITPPFYAPAVYQVDAATYRVTRAGCPTVNVDLQRRECDAEHCDGWCIHLRAAQLYHTRGLTDD